MFCILSFVICHLSLVILFRDPFICHSVTLFRDPLICHSVSLFRSAGARADPETCFWSQNSNWIRNNRTAWVGKWGGDCWLWVEKWGRLLVVGGEMRRLVVMGGDRRNEKIVGYGWSNGDDCWLEVEKWGRLLIMGEETRRLLVVGGEMGILLVVRGEMGKIVGRGWKNGEDC